MGIAQSALSESFPPKTRFTAEDVPDLTGKVAIVTGANAGIGKETARALVAKNAKVYVATRSEEKAKTAIEEIKTATGKDSAHFLQLDLSDLEAIKKSADEFTSKETELHILINNAGVMVPPIDMVTKDGYDLQFGTNVLGHFYFTKLLLPTLISTAKHSPDGKVRVVNVSSLRHLSSSKEIISYQTLKDGPERRKLGTGALYGQSKSGNILFARELAKRYSDQGIVSTSLNPGNIRTELQRHMPTLIRKAMNFVLYPVNLGAVTQIYAATAPEAADLNGKYLIPWARVSPPRQDHLDPNASEKLWNWLEEQVPKS